VKADQRRATWRRGGLWATIRGMKSRVHPKYKTKYRVGNWAEYDRALLQRGDITLWLTTDAIAAWRPAPSGRRGGQRKFSDQAIETALTLRLVFKLPLRQAEGFLRSVLALMGVALEAPDHTTLSRRSQRLDVALHLVPIKEPIHLIVDSTGLSIVGEGEWAAVKHGGRGRRGWKKLHLGVDRSGVIVTGALTDGNADDAKTALDLLDEVEGEITSVTADAAYDTIAIYAGAAARSAKVVVPPLKTATSSRRPRFGSNARDRTIMRGKEIGRRRWKKESEYHRQARVENTFFRYKSIVGDRLRARHPKSQETEAIIGCNILNRMIAFGRPESLAIAD
jgi:IS5 family transposase